MVGQTSVLVVGAGPTGLLLASELRRRGIDAHIVDANAEPQHWDRATVVHPRSLEIFESLGILQPLLDAGVKQRIARLHSAGKLLGEIDLALCGSRYGFNIGISEEFTESILTQYLEAHGGSVQRASKLLELQQRDDAVIATIDHNGESQQVAAEWLVGCDGVRGTTRTLAGIELVGHDLTEPWAVFDATVPNWSDSYEGNFAYLDHTPVILTSLPQQRWRVYLRPTSPESDLVADALATLRPYLPAIEFADVSHPARFHCQSKIAERYRAGRVLLAGDAAHVCSPSQGHGMNSGLQDAYNLAWKLALVCSGRSSPALLDSYEVERHPVAEMITTSGEAFEKSQGLTDAAAIRTRDDALRAVFADPASRHHESVAEAELDIDYARSPIVLGDKHPALGPGGRLPDVIEVSLPHGEPALLHALTSRGGHTALILGGSSTPIVELERIAALVPLDDIEATIKLTMRSDADGSCARLASTGANLLGVADVTLLVVRPDGHIGLRADRDHASALLAYVACLKSGGK